MAQMLKLNGNDDSTQNTSSSLFCVNKIVKFFFFMYWTFLTLQLIIALCALTSDFYKLMKGFVLWVPSRPQTLCNIFLLFTEEGVSHRAVR